MSGPTLHQRLRGSAPAWRAAALFGIAAVFFALFLLGQGGPREYVVVDLLGSHPYALTGCAVALSTLAAICLAERSAAAVTFIILGAVCCCGLLGLKAFTLLGAGFLETDRLDGPEGADFKAVAVEEAFFFESNKWSVRIRQTDGLFSRQWDVTCTAERPRLTWSGPNTLRVRADGTVATFTISRSGRPDHASDELTGCFG